jgi:hypothetical protein
MDSNDKKLVVYHQLSHDEEPISLHDLRENLSVIFTFQKEADMT